MAFANILVKGAGFFAGGIVNKEAISFKEQREKGEKGQTERDKEQFGGSVTVFRTSHNGSACVHNTVFARCPENKSSVRSSTICEKSYSFMGSVQKFLPAQWWTVVIYLPGNLELKLQNGRCFLHLETH